MGLPFILGTLVYVFIIVALTVWLKNFHTKKCEHQDESVGGLNKYRERVTAEICPNGNLNSADDSFTKDSQTMLNNQVTTGEQSGSEKGRGV